MRTAAVVLSLALLIMMLIFRRLFFRRAAQRYVMLVYAAERATLALVTPREDITSTTNAGASVARERGCLIVTHTASRYANILLAPALICRYVMRARRVMLHMLWPDEHTRMLAIAERALLPMLFMPCCYA